MKSLLHRSFAIALLAVITVAMAAGAATRTPTLEPDKLVILSTTDVKGKTMPCG